MKEMIKLNLNVETDELDKVDVVCDKIIKLALQIKEGLKQEAANESGDTDSKCDDN